MSSPVGTTAWGRIRHHLRRLLGRTRFDVLERELRELREQLRSRDHAADQRARAESERAASEHARWRAESERSASELVRAHLLQGERAEAAEESLRSLGDHLRSLETRLSEGLSEQLELQWRSFESRRAPLLSLIDQLRSAVEESVVATARMDAMILRTLEKGQEIEDEMSRRGSRLAEVLDGLRQNIADAVQRLEERHQEWLSSQRVTQQALVDQHAAIDGRWTTGLDELRQSFATGSERGATMQRELDAARSRERALADQTAHLIELLGQTRRELSAASERAAEADEAQSARVDLERELERVREDLEASAAEVEEVREAHRSFHRWKGAADAEISRLSEERDRLLLETLRAEDASRGAQDPSFGAPGV
ncbi:MAG: hypothetical protein JNM84_27055 [Planctomycetes bacterium]|nr:hypothetical protein [Planctomycetota bacterium]